MLDYKFIKDNLDAVKENIKNRNMTADADIVVKLYDERTAMVTELQALQQKRNENAQSMKQKLDNDKRQELIAAGKAIKDEIATLEAKMNELEQMAQQMAAYQYQQNQNTNTTQSSNNNDDEAYTPFGDLLKNKN